MANNVQKNNLQFSVLLPTKNRLEYLKHAIASVQSQDYEHWEVIVSDNCSEDDVEGYVKSINDSRIKYFKTSAPCRVTDNWNNALEQCSGDYAIMLGDDDALLPNYFTRASALIEQYGCPEVLYSHVLHYAYPKVIPNSDAGFLAKFGCASFFVGHEKPFILPREEALSYLKETLNFTVVVNFNMQHSLVSRKLINKMKKYGQFYQSPYPDYYATTMILAKAESLLVVPFPMAVIGISPKSFGYYYFNGKEAEGVKMLQNTSDAQEAGNVEKYFLQGTSMNTSWLVAMEAVRLNLKDESPFKVNYNKYRFIQMMQTLKNFVLNPRANALQLFQLVMKLFWWEKLCYSVPMVLTILCRSLGGKEKIVSIINKMGRISHPEHEPAKIYQGTYKNISEVVVNNPIESC